MLRGRLDNSLDVPGLLKYINEVSTAYPVE